MPEATKNVMITGSNRGIGLGLVKEILAGCPHTNIFAAVRNYDDCKELQELAKIHNTIHIIHMDVTSEDDIKNAVESVSRVVGECGLHILVNNAGYLKRVEASECCCKVVPMNLAGEDRDSFMTTFRVNCLGPFLVSRAFIPLLAKSSGHCPQTCCHSPLIVNISSYLSSIENCDSGQMLSYRMSKAALNMLTKAMSIELVPHHITVVSVSPGWVKTRMGGPDALIPVSDSVKSVVKVIKSVTEKDNGFSINLDGSRLPW